MGMNTMAERVRLPRVERVWDKTRTQEQILRDAHQWARDAFAIAREVQRRGSGVRRAAR